MDFLSASSSNVSIQLISPTSGDVSLKRLFSFEGF